MATQTLIEILTKRFNKGSSKCRYDCDVCISLIIPELIEQSDDWRQCVWFKRVAAEGDNVEIDELGGKIGIVCEFTGL